MSEIFKVKFISPGRVERAPPPGESGFRVEVIPVGTEMEMREPSYRFWKAKGCVELLKKPEGRRHPPAEEPRPNPFQTPREPVETRPLPSRTSIRRAATDARRAVPKGDAALVQRKLNYILVSEARQVVAVDEAVWARLAGIAEVLKDDGKLPDATEDLIAALRAVEVAFGPPARIKQVPAGAADDGESAAADAGPSAAAEEPAGDEPDED